jgi:hypothetical protein
MSILKIIRKRTILPKVGGVGGLVHTFAYSVFRIVFVFRILDTKYEK